MSCTAPALPGRATWRACHRTVPRARRATACTTRITTPSIYFTKYSSASGGWCNSANLGSEGVLPAPSASGLVTALDGANAPDFVFLVPNDCDDMHGDTSAGSPCAKSSNAQLIKAGDTWLSNLLPGVLNSAWFSQDGIVIITWDEGSDSSGCCGLSSPGGHIPTHRCDAAGTRVRAHSGQPAITTGRCALSRKHMA